jgi:urea transporter
MPNALSAAWALAQRYLVAIGQTFFVGSPWTGLVGAATVAFAAPIHAFAALATCVVARWTGVRAGASRALLDSGIIELNGWFMGLACAAFLDRGPGLAAAILAGGPLVAAFTIAMQRFVATWNLPLLVGPYMPAFWLLWAAVSGLPWVHPVVPSAVPLPDWPPLAILVGGLRGVGQIFFVPDVRVGLALALASSLRDWRVGPAMLAASIASVGLGYLAGAPTWQTEQGLAGFTPAMVTAAALSRFGGMSYPAVGIAILAGPFLEAAALRICGSIGIYALSASYVGFVWTCALVRPVRKVSELRSSWSMREHPPLFETGRPVTIEQTTNARSWTFFSRKRSAAD